VTDVEPAAARAPVRSNSLLLGQLSFLSGTAQEMVYPLIPTFVVVALGSSATLFGGIEGVLAFGVTLARLGSARALDRGFSPRRLLVASYLASLVSRPLLALAPNVATVAALRTVDGLGKGGKDAPKDSLVALDAGAGRAGRAFGVLRALDTAGSVAGPVIAGLLLLALGHGERGLRIVFALAAIPAVAGLLTLRQVRDAPPATPRHSGEARPPLPPAFKVLLVAALVFPETAPPTKPAGRMKSMPSFQGGLGDGEERGEREYACRAKWAKPAHFAADTLQVTCFPKLTAPAPQASVPLRCLEGARGWHVRSCPRRRQLRCAPPSTPWLD